MGATVVGVAGVVVVVHADVERRNLRPLPPILPCGQYSVLRHARLPRVRPLESRQVGESGLRR